MGGRAIVRNTPQQTREPRRQGQGPSAMAKPLSVNHTERVGVVSEVALLNEEMGCGAALKGVNRRSGNDASDAGLSKDRRLSPRDWS